MQILHISLNKTKYIKQPPVYHDLHLEETKQLAIPVTKNPEKNIHQNVYNGFLWVVRMRFLLHRFSLFFTFSTKNMFFL